MKSLQRTEALDPMWLLLAPVATAALLLTFFLLLSSSTSFVLQPGIAVQPPRASFLQPPQHNALVVSITALPSPGIFFDHQKADLQQLEKWLSSQYQRTHSLIIKADKCSPTGLVTEVLNRGLQYGYSVILATQNQ